MTDVNWDELCETDLNGYCHAFALALMQRYGWTLAALRDEHDHPVHVVCLCGGNVEELADVSGVSSSDELRGTIHGGEDTWLDLAVTPGLVKLWMDDGILPKVGEKEIGEAMEVIEEILTHVPGHLGEGWGPTERWIAELTETHPSKAALTPLDS